MEKTREEKVQENKLYMRENVREREERKDWGKLRSRMGN